MKFICCFASCTSCFAKDEITNIIQGEPTGQYSRKIWFLYEWLRNEKLDIPDLTIKKAIPLVDEKLQYAIEGKITSRLKSDSDINVFFNAIRNNEKNDVEIKKIPFEKNLCCV